MTNTKTDASLEKQENQALQRAIDYLGAVEVAPGLYAMQAPDKWITFTGESLHEWAEGPQNHITFEVKLRRRGAMMPAWWSPQRQKVFRRKPSEYSGKARILSAPALGYERITCDLMTGEEIPA